MATYYYAYINSSNIVEQIVDLPAPITAPSYISIGSHDVSLIGKRYNAETSQFEVVTWFCYAILSEKDIVTQVIRRETALSEVPSNMILIQSYDETLVGKWYNRAAGTFSAPPIHVLAELSTDKINVGAQDLWLTDKLGAIDGKLGLIDGILDRSVKCKIAETSDNTIFEASRMSKHYRYQFENPVAGYLPKYVFLQVTWGGEPFDDEDTLNIWLVRNGEDTDLYTLCRQGEIIHNADNTEKFQGQTNFMYYPKANSKEGCFTMNSYLDKMTTRGGDAFIAFVSGSDKGRYAKIGKFKYDTTGFEFDINSYCAEPAVLSTRFAFRAFAY